jgi:hypothetical protein
MPLPRELSFYSVIAARLDISSPSFSQLASETLLGLSAGFLPSLAVSFGFGRLDFIAPFHMGSLVWT